MAHRPLVLTLAAGAALTASTGLLGCSGKTSTSTPPPDATRSGDEADAEPDLEPPPAPDTTSRPPQNPTQTANPPAPGLTPAAVMSNITSRDPSRAEWDDVPSPHPPGATNPPSPVLIVTPDGDCFKRWEGGMIPTGGDRVEVVSADGSTTAINCPPERAEQTYEAWVAAGRPDPTIPGFPPKDF